MALISHTLLFHFPPQKKAKRRGRGERNVGEVLWTLFSFCFSGLGAALNGFLCFQIGTRRWRSVSWPIKYYRQKLLFLVGLLVRWWSLQIIATHPSSFTYSKQRFFFFFLRPMASYNICYSVCTKIIQAIVAAQQQQEVWRPLAPRSYTKLLLLLLWRKESRNTYLLVVLKDMPPPPPQSYYLYSKVRAPPTLFCIYTKYKSTSATVSLAPFCSQRDYGSAYLFKEIFVCSKSVALAVFCVSPRALKYFFALYVIYSQ